MSTIGNQSYQLLNSLQNTVAKASESKETSSSAKSQEQTQLSTQSQKLAEIGREFFADGPMKYADIPKLAAKLSEINLITPAVAAQFKVDDSSDTDVSEELGEFARSKAAAIDEKDNENGVIEMLNFVADLFDDVETVSKQDDFASQIKQAQATLSQLLLTDEFKTFAADDQSKYRGLNQGLDLIQSLPEARQDQSKLNQYLEILRLA